MSHYNQTVYSDDNIFKAFIFSGVIYSQRNKGDKHNSYNNNFLLFLVALKALHFQEDSIRWPLCPGQSNMLALCFPRCFLDRGLTFLPLNSLELLCPPLSSFTSGFPLSYSCIPSGPPRYPRLPLPPMAWPASFHSAPFIRSSNLYSSSWRPLPRSSSTWPELCFSLFTTADIQPLFSLLSAPWAPGLSGPC